MNRYYAVTILLTAILLVGATTAFAGPIYVKPTASGTGDGSSWANAMGSIQTALNLASTSGRSVWVMGGTYNPGATLNWPSNAKAFGGFHDGDTLLSQRDITGSPSIITGANARRVINVNSVTNTRIDGFTITNGRENWGGGIRCDALDGSNVIANCRIQNCVAPGDYGGGMASNGCTGHIIENCVFEGNTSSSLGGGLFIHHSDAVLLDCVFSNNRNAFWGGAGAVVMSATAATRFERCAFLDNRVEGGDARGAGLFIMAAPWHDVSRLCQISVVNCRFESNFTRQDMQQGGGGGMAVINASPAVRNCYFANNSTQNGGGAVLVSAEDASRPINATFDDCVIHANTAGWNSAGGGFHLSAALGTASNVTINNCSITNNQTIGDGSGGGIWTGPRVVLRINDTTFRDNTTYHETWPGGHGGGIMADGAGADVAVNRCSFIGNNVWHPTLGYWGGAMFSHGGAHVQAWNTIFDRNGGHEGGGAAVHGSGSRLWLFYCTLSGNNRWGARAASSGELVATNSIAWGNDSGGLRWESGTAGWSAYCNTQDGHGGTGNISQNPLFVDAGNGNLRLQSGSPSRNTGDPDNNAYPLFDVLNNTRPFGGRRDMGAFEWNNSPAPSVVSIVPRAGEANPTRVGLVSFTVTFNKGIGGQTTSSLSGLTPGHFSLTTTGDISGASIARVTGSGTTRTVVVNTGTGSGSIRLNLNNSNNVACSGNQSLSNVPFSGGTAYTIDKTPPQVASITRTDANPTNAANVDFTITFTEPVSTVAETDFDLLASGVTGASIAGISGSGANYTVSVNTGTGDGTVAIRYGNGAAVFDGAGSMHNNWLFDSEEYSIDKTPPTAACRNITVTLPGPIAMTPGDIDDGSADNVGIAAWLINGAPSIDITHTDYPGTDVTLRVVDAAGNWHECAATVTVNKATPTATLHVTNSPVTYDGGAKAATVGVASSSTPGAAASVLTGGAADQTNAGTYVVTADFVPTDTNNYNTLTGLASGDFVINKATPTATLEVTNSPVIYDGSAKAATVGVASSSTPGAAANVLTGGAADQTNAGTYAVTADFVPTDTANYNTLTGLSAGNFVINKATPTATLEVTNSPVTYDGSAKAATVGVASSSTAGAAANVLTGGAASQTNAGTYTVTADFVPTDTTNYNSLTGLSVGDFVISKATPMATLSVTNSPVTYNGAARGAVVGVTTSSTPGAAQNILMGGVASQTNVGTYAVIAEFVPTDAANYNSLPGLAAGDFVINKATITVELVDVIKLWDGDTDVTLSPMNFSVQGLAPGESLVISQTEGAFSSSDIGSDTPVSANLVGFIVAGPGTELNNYELPDTANGLGTITDKFIPVVTWPTASAIVFGQVLSASTLSGGSATDPYTSDPVDGTFAFDDDTIVPPAAGSYSADVTFTPADPATYASRQTQVPISVQKATPVVVTPPTASILREGHSLADSALTGGEASVDGDFDWADDAIIPLLGASDQSVTFTPVDADNYAAVLLEVSVTVIPAVDLAVNAVGDTYFIRPLEGSVTFAVQVQGSLGALSYQWYKLTDDKAQTPVGPDASVFTIDPIVEQDFGEYLCEVYDSMLDETAESPVFTLVLTTGVPAFGLLGLALASALTALAGASVLRKKY